MPAVGDDATVSTYRPSGRTLVDLLEGATARYGDRPALRLRKDDGTQQVWSYRELDRRSRLAPGGSAPAGCSRASGS